MTYDDYDGLNVSVFGNSHAFAKQETCKDAQGNPNTMRFPQ